MLRRQEIVNFNCRSLVASVPFFTNADPSFVSEIVGQLQFEVYLPGDLIIKEGTPGTKMFFIQEGFVDIVANDGTVTTCLGDGSYFGGQPLTLYNDVIFFLTNFAVKNPTGLSRFVNC